MPKVYNHDKCFFEFASECGIRRQLLDYARSRSSEEWAAGEVYWGNPSIAVPSELYADEKIINWLRGSAVEENRIRIVRIEDSVFQSFRVDPEWQMAVCSLLDPGVNTRLFYGVGKNVQQQIHTEQVPLNPDQYYLLNMQLKHAMYNPGEQYLLMVPFKAVNPDPTVAKQEATVNFAKLVFKLTNEGL